MPRLEHLFLVLALKVHAVVYILVTDLDPLDRLILAHGVDILLHDVGLWLGLLAACWLHHVWKLFDVVRADVSDLERWHL